MLGLGGGGVGAVFSPCCLTRCQTMVEVMRIMVTSFNRSHAHIATLTAPNPAAGHRWPTFPLENPGHRQVWVSLLWGHCSFLLGPGAHKFVLCPPRVCFPVLCKFWRLYGGLMVTSSKRVYATPRSAEPRAAAPAAVHRRPAPPQETLTHSSSSVTVGSLGPGVHKVCLRPLGVSGGYGVWF